MNKHGSLSDAEQEPSSLVVVKPGEPSSHMTQGGALSMPSTPVKTSSSSGQ